MFAREDFVEMAELLAGLKGRFILSINDRPEVRELFAACKFDMVDCTYSVAGGTGKAARELIVRNSG